MSSPSAFPSFACSSEPLTDQGALAIWNYRLTFAQRLANPPGFFVFVTVVVGAALAAPLKYGFFPAILVPVIVVIGFATVWLRNAPGVTARSSDEVIVAVRPGFIGIGSGNLVHWIPRYNVANLRHGILQCHVLTLISGHTFVMPSKIAEDAYVANFMRQKRDIGSSEPSQIRSDQDMGQQ